MNSVISFAFGCLFFTAFPHLAVLFACFWVLHKMYTTICEKPQEKGKQPNLIHFYFNGSKVAFFMFVLVTVASLTIPWMLVFLTPFIWQLRNHPEKFNA